MNTLPPGPRCPTQLRVQRARRIGVLRAMADAHFINADRATEYAKGCTATSNPDGAASWQRMSGHYRQEAETFRQEADKLERLQ
ncbi:MAG: hypothetical protein ABF628_00905 [Acetobacter orientalis]|uniref:hypothetical protein n=1 Tax=Acetobacter orientalis TaxID=146474 RepID=UPI0039EC6E79